ncbi:MAG: LysR family transcriptional regulator [Pseudomonadota bacterium]
MDRLRELEVFVEIASATSMAEAGRRLNLSPPAVTRILAGLEDRIGARLVQRTTRSLNLTEAGQRFLAAAERLLLDMDAAEREAAGTGIVPQGRVAITASTSFGRLAVVPLFAEFLAAHPRVTGSVHLWDRNVNLVDEGIDVAVRIGPLPDAGLIARRCGDVRRMLVASPEYLARHGAPEHADDLALRRIIAFRGVMPTNRIALAGVSRTVEPWIVLNDALSALALAEGNHGITMTMSYLARSRIADGALVEVLPDLAPAKVPVNLVWPEARMPTAAVRSFIDTVQPQLAGLLS